MPFYAFPKFQNSLLKPMKKEGGGVLVRQCCMVTCVSLLGMRVRVICRSRKREAWLINFACFVAN